MTVVDSRPVRQQPSVLDAFAWVAAGIATTIATVVIWVALHEQLKLDTESAGWLAMLFAAVVLWRAGRRHWVYAVACLGGGFLTVASAIGLFLWAWSNSPDW
jgi:hypothetical protein